MGIDLVEIIERGSSEDIEDKGELVMICERAVILSITVSHGKGRAKTDSLDRGRGAFR